PDCRHFRRADVGAGAASRRLTRWQPADGRAACVALAVCRSGAGSAKVGATFAVRSRDRPKTWNLIRLDLVKTDQVPAGMCVVDVESRRVVESPSVLASRY